MTNNCLITICTSFYNVEKYMESFISQLKNQTCPDFVCILVDDGSTDKSYKNCVKAIGDDERFSIIKHEKNKGIGEGRITCIENCKTEYITYLDYFIFLYLTIVGLHYDRLSRQNKLYLP